MNPETLGNATAPDFEFRYIDIGSVSQGRIDWGTVQKIRFSDSPSRARRLLRPGDTLLSTVRPLLGSHTHAAWDEREGYVCSTGFAVIRAREGLASSFLKHLPFAEQVTRQLVAWQCGTNYPAVNERDVHLLQLPAPLPDEQAAIARILDAVDTAIERTRDAVTQSRVLQKSALAEAFERMHGEKRRLREFTTEVRYGTSQAASDRGWGYPTLRIPNVIGDQLTLDDLTFVDAKLSEASRLTLRDGDLLLVRTNGNPNYVGRSAVFRAPDDRQWLYASYLIRVRLRDGLLPDYANVFLGMEQGRRELLRRVTTSAGNHNINSNSVRLLLIPVPRSTGEQERIVDLARSLRDHSFALANKVTALLELKESLMHDLLTGRVRADGVALESVRQP